MFHGSIVAMVTPMNKSGEIDYASFEQLIDWHLEQGTQGLVVLGTTGEQPTIETPERAGIIKHAVAQVAEKIPVIVGTGSNSTRHSIEMTQQAMELGADAALLVTPYYNKPTQEGLFYHFQEIAKAVPIPQVLYNVPTRTGCDLLPATLEKLAKISNIVAVKEATGDLNRLKDILALNSQLDLLSGDDASAIEFILQGGRGVISVTANVAPRLMASACEAALRGDRAEAEKYNAKIAALNKQLFVESNPIPVKWALNEMGKIKEGIRLPLTWLNSKFHPTVREAMRQAEIQSLVF